MEKVLQEIRDEREYQKKRYDQAFDDANTPNDWVSYITTYAGQAGTATRNDRTLENFRKMMVKVAALAVAAVEAADRGAAGLKDLRA